ncbi:hypothetical protein [Sphingomonas sp.]|nr:hypothetical protein [Sphingomonas sp.]MBX3594961.1 hypothetical protein [Sphingomonas sp.]
MSAPTPPPRDARAQPDPDAANTLFDRIHRSPRIPDRYAAWRTVSR